MYSATTLRLAHRQAASRGYAIARRSLSTSANVSAASPSPSTSPTGKEEGTIASVFATLSGGSLDDALPPRFSDLKRRILTGTRAGDAPRIRAHLEKSWRELLPVLASEMTDISTRKQAVLPSVEYPSHADGQGLKESLSPQTIADIKKRGVVVIKNVIPSSQVLQWKQDIREYARENNARGFPEDNPQVYELYWSKAQIAARSHPALLDASRSILSLWHSPATDADTNSSSLPISAMADMTTPLTYADRLRIRQPGDSKFALGAHIDGGGVERWEDDAFRSVWDQILDPDHGSWPSFDNWSLGANGQRMTARGDMYNGPGQCSVFRPLQGWLSMSQTGPGEGTLRVLPNLREATAYIVLRPFFHPSQTLQQCDNNLHHYLDTSNWHFDADHSSKFPGCSLGHNIELSSTTHPHLRLDETMTSLSHVSPGDFVLWHCDAVHSVESTHAGLTDSSVMYIPAIPLTANNWSYIQKQADDFRRGVPPPDFPGGKGESQFKPGTRATEEDIVGDTARTAMGLASPVDRGDALDRLRQWCSRP